MNCRQNSWHSAPCTTYKQLSHLLKNSLVRNAWNGAVPEYGFGDPTPLQYLELSGFG
ncbi:hypothetical protein CA54_60410 [Symmachiella macrocystis]|uniref:Uncharacterized protein n=1 Tax=Symmachiella macrocystis TaxID=2527985 RepID=A0A5C6AYD0_9PLAN|nr:hypothetical protein CA54_60410 [Symmachiella macrocystis]